MLIHSLFYSLHLLEIIFFLSFSVFFPSFFAAMCEFIYFRFFSFLFFSSFLFLMFLNRWLSFSLRQQHDGCIYSLFTIYIYLFIDSVLFLLKSSYVIFYLVCNCDQFMRFFFNSLEEMLMYFNFKKQKGTVYQGSEGIQPISKSLFQVFFSTLPSPDSR